MNHYYEKSQHQYLQSHSDSFADLIFEKITPLLNPEMRTALEIGAGMGRFSDPVVRHYQEVILCEPSESFFSVLKEKFAYKDTVRLFNCSYEEVFSSVQLNCATIFCFHVLHHLSDSQIQSLFHQCTLSKSMLVAVDPNPLNPLLLAQILIEKDMKFSEEIGYLSLRVRKLARLSSKEKMNLVHHELLCPIPPFASHHLLKKVSLDKYRKWSQLLSKVPFINSYQLNIFSPV